MTGKGQMAMAVGAGYMLGRTHKMKLALMLAGFGASRRFPTGSLGVLNEGRKLLADSPEVAKLGVTVRKELMNAVKAAAVTAASQRIDSLNTRLESGEDLVGGLGKAVGGKKKSKRARVEEPEDEYEGEAYAEDEGEPDDEGDNETGDDDSEQAPRGRRRPAPRRRSSSGGSSRPTRSRSRSSKDDDEEDDLARARARRTRAKATTDSVPVRRRTRK
ncbi:MULTISPECIES: hypothetical protein [unclassified Rhodococcus (in: high G+C Gram-positive bacteria)]|uniref:hypothetical protein n=1 Tax=unclassified Rhodococcus (in: high G+C Gram-positive bacteria) TaxID=192944 RepID=UPI0024B81F90|nr:MULTISPECIES: hypothetical protein [unclassified Rhodococcus (in: high G+C Gram-positive bacteria)]MDI9954118.1 hypothetical protein [Rhodococcus sp. IEGM 1305]MDI9973807.1 hypothetical protein [Rhodococcus sp. IEGM 1307]